MIGRKPAGEPYRLDEETLLAEAVSRIGLDLYALKVEELEEATAQLSLKLERFGHGSALKMEVMQADGRK